MDTIKRIFEVMKQNNINQSALAEKMGVSRGLITQWKQGKYNPSSELIVKFATIFNVSVDYLYGLSAIPNAYGAEESYKHTKDEKDLLSAYRQLTPNSKQIVMSLVQGELNHVKAFIQGETPIKIVRSSKLGELDKIVSRHLESIKDDEDKPLLKVYSFASAAGFGNYLFDDSEENFEMIAVSCVPAGTDFGIPISGDSMEPKIHDGDIAFVRRQQNIEIGEIGIFVYNGESYCKKLAYDNKNYYLRSLNTKYKDIPILNDSIYCVGKVIESGRAN